MTTTQHNYLTDHTLRAPKLLFHLDEETERLRELRQRQDQHVEGIALVKERGLNVVLTVLRAGARLTEHEPRGASTILVLEGSIAMSTGDKEELLGRGDLIAFDAKVRREGTALEDSVILTTVSLGVA